MCVSSNYCTCDPSKEVVSPDKKSKDVLIYKSAQLRKTTQKEEENEVDFLPILENLTTIKDKKKLSKKCKRKFIGSNLSLGLVNLRRAKQEIKSEEMKADKIDPSSYEYRSTINKETKILKSYWNMFNCNKTVILTKEGNVITRYCKNRLCLVCNAIRTAGLIDLYQYVFQAWENDIFLVTLTVKNVGEKHLESTVNTMFKNFVRCKDRINKRLKKEGSSQKFQGLKKFECTSNKDNDYHPHFHILVKGEQLANELKNEWLEVSNKYNLEANPLGQDVRKAGDGVEKELFKYFTKIISRSTKENVKDKDGKMHVHLHRLDNIFEATRGKRVFQNFGFVISHFHPLFVASHKDREGFDHFRKPIKLHTINNPILDPPIETISRTYKQIEPKTLSEEEEEEKELLFEFDNVHSFQKHINLMWEKANLLDPKLRNRNSEMNFLADLYEYQASFNNIFNIEKNTFDLKNREEVYEEMFLECEKAIDNQVFISIDYDIEEIHEEEEEEKQDEVFVWNSDMWYSIETGLPLFDYNVGLLKEVIKRFKVPQKYALKIKQLQYYHYN